MEKWKKRSIDLFTSLAFGCDGTPSVVPYYPQKTKISSAEERFFRRSTPERHGISSKRIYSMLAELETSPRANLHSLMILRDGEVICECSRDGYGVNIAHLSHSMSKTVCGMIIGTLICDGTLGIDSRVVDIFPEIPYRDKRFATLTVRHLLNMMSGVDFAEAGSITESAWTRAFFDSTMHFAPGTRFAYNSMNSYILARIAERVSGEVFSDIARERIFAPLGIENYFWEKSPEGTEKGGWGLYMSVESWAKVGYTFLSGGSFFGRRILPHEWIGASVKGSVDTGITSEFDYGYHLWTLHEGGEYLFNGMLGQNVWICPKNRIIAVMSGGNNELFQDSAALNIIRRHLATELGDELYRRDVRALREKEAEFYDSRRFVRPKEHLRSIFRLFGIGRRRSTDTSFMGIVGEYRFGKNNVGLLPLVVRAMQNNLDSSLESLELRYVGDRLVMHVLESGEEHIIGVGIYRYESSVLTFRGEKYVVRCMGEALVGPEGRAEYRIEIIFPELPNTRYIRIFPEVEGEIKIEFSESPNDKIVENLFTRMSETSSIASVAIEIIERRFGVGIVADTMKRAFTPTLIGIDASAEGYETRVAEQSKRQRSNSRAVWLIRMVVDRFFKESGAEEEKAALGEPASEQKPQKNKKEKTVKPRQRTKNNR